MDKQKARSRFRKKKNKRAKFGEPTQCAQQIQQDPTAKERSGYRQTHGSLNLLLAMAADGPTTLKTI